MTDIESLREKKKEIDEQLKALEDKDKTLGIYKPPRGAKRAFDIANMRIELTTSGSRDRDSRSVIAGGVARASADADQRVQSAGVVPLRRSIDGGRGGVGSVASAPLNLQTEKPRPSLKLDDDASKARNKRMFGNLLMGTLREAKKEVAVETDTEKRRHEIQEKVDKMIESEQENSVDAKRRKLIKAKAELTQQQSVLEQERLTVINAKVLAPLAGFRKTKATPAIYWRSRSEEARLGGTTDERDESETTTAAATTATTTDEGAATATTTTTANNDDDNNNKATTATKTDDAVSLNLD